jgi:RNA polymerase sigma factor (sigma-70 family)
MKLSTITKEQAQEILNSDRKFSQFINTNTNFLRRMVHKQIMQSKLNYNDSELFNDLFQEASLSLWKKALPNYNGSTKFSTFAFTVIRNDLLQYLLNKTKFERQHGPLASIETSIRKTEDSESSEYNEKYWKKPSKISFEDEILNRLTEEKLTSKLSPLDQKVLDLKKKGFKKKAIAEKIGMNYHSYRSYHFYSFVPKIKQLGIKI